MATELWSTMTSRGALLTTQLNSLSNGSYSNGGTALANNSNLDRFALAELSVTFGSSPVANATLILYALLAPDGTDYSSGSSSVVPSNQLFAGTFVVQANTSAQLIHTARFELLPCPIKFMLYNASGQALPASGTTVTIYTFDRTIG